jgi:hypothetical protein
MTPGNALIDRWFAELDKENEVTQLTPYRDDSHRVLVDENRQLQVAVSKLTSQLEQHTVSDAAVARARIAIHTSCSLFLYALFAAVFSDGPLLEHPHLAAVVATGNLLVWTLVSTWRRFGS